LGKPAYLLDVNVLVALVEPEHVHHQIATDWFGAPDLDWGLCAFTEAGFLRVATNPKAGGHSVAESTQVLSSLTHHSGYRFWSISAGWEIIAAPLEERVFGHQQITDAWLLGLAIQENGVLVTFDKAIKFLAGKKYASNVLVLGS